MEIIGTNEKNMDLYTYTGKYRRYKRDYDDRKEEISCW